MKGFTYFSSWLIEGRPGILAELEKQFQFYEGKLGELKMERGRRIRLEEELGKSKPISDGEVEGVDIDIQMENVREAAGGVPSSSAATGSKEQVTPDQFQVQEEGLRQGLPSSSLKSSTKRKARKSPYPKRRAVSKTPTGSVPVGTPEEQVKEGGEEETFISEVSVTPAPESNQANDNEFSDVIDTVMSTSSDAQAQVTQVTGGNPVEAPNFENCLVPPSMASGHHSKELEQLWTLVTESCLPDFEPETRIRSIELVAKVNIPYPSQLELLGFICGNASAQGRDWNCSRSLHCLRLLESLLNNPSIRCEVHVTCIKKTIEKLFSAAATKLEGQPTSTEWWELLDSGASLLGKMAKMWKAFRESLNLLLNLRLTEVFVLEIAGHRGLPLMTLYHTISTVLELGEWEILTLVLPNLAHLGKRCQLVELYVVGSAEVPKLEEVAMERMRSKIVETVAPILASMRKLPDPLPDYETEFGKFFGGKLFHRVRELRGHEP